MCVRERMKTVHTNHASFPRGTLLPLNSVTARSKDFRNPVALPSTCWSCDGKCEQSVVAGRRILRALPGSPSVGWGLTKIASYHAGGAQYHANDHCRLSSA